MFSYSEKKKLQYSLRHPCHLPETENILVRYIDSGYFVDLRRKIRKFTMCSENNPRTKLFLKSTASINFEKAYHLHYYYTMIHPFSFARVYWEMYMMVVFLVLLSYIPIDACVLQTKGSLISKAVLDLICAVDIVMTFRTGYQHELTKKVIMDSRKVAANYLKSWFLIDFCATINIDLVMIILHIDTTNYYWFVKAPALLRIFRLVTLSKYFDRLRQWTNISLYKGKVTKLVIVVTILALWNTCILYALAKNFKEDWFQRAETASYQGLRICFLRIITNFLLISHGDKSSKSTTIQFAEMVWLTCGFILQLWLTGQVVQIVLKYTSLGDKYYQMVQQFQEYMKSKNLPETVRKRVISFFEFRFQRNYYKENDILGSLSNQLRQEIIFHTGKDLLTKTVMFNDLPNALLIRIGFGMNMEIFLPNDVVVTAGGRADSMYFIMTGMVAVYVKSGKEVCHLGDGSYFGEGALFSRSRTRLATVVAIDFCEMYTLNNDFFAKAVAPYPDLLQRILKIANDRLKAFLKAEKARRTSNVFEDDTSQTRLYYNV